MNEHRLSPEFRVQGRTLSGVALRYGDTADMGSFRERFVPGAFGDVETVDVNLQHDGGLVVARDALLTDSPRELRVRAELPEGSAALSLVRRGALNGFSIEFHAVEEHREAGVRVISAAVLSGLALCDRGAYPSSRPEIRRRGSRGGRLGSFRGRIPKNKRLECRCSPGSCREALFKQGSFDSLFDDEDVRDVLAVAGDYSNAIGSRNRKTVRFWQGKDGDLEFAVDVPNSDRGKALMDTFDATDVYARPVIDADASIVEIKGTLAEYTKARVRALTIGPTDAAAGWDPLVEVSESASELAEKARKLAGISRPARQRAKIWL